MADEYNVYQSGMGLYEITLNNIADITKVAENFEKINDKVGNIDSIVFEGAEEQIEFKSVEAFLKFLWGKVGNIELTDTKVKVTTQNNKMLNVVIEELKTKDTEIINTMNAYKTSVEEMNQLLGVEATSINAANERFRSLVEGGVSVD